MLCDAQDGLVQLCVVDAQPGFFGELFLQHFRDHPLQYLLFQNISVRQHGLLSLQHLRYAGCTVLEFLVGDDIVIHHHFDAVDGRALFLRPGCKSGGCECNQDEG